MSTLSSLIIPLVIIAVGFIMFRRPTAFDSFVRGAKDGARTTASILPVMIALMCALSMFTSSGAAELIVRAASPLCEAIGIPVQILPLAVTRPISGSAASATFASLLDEAGADSLAGFTASILMGSSDTLVYVIAMYFGKTRVKSAARAFAIAGASAVLCLFLSSFLARLFFT